MNGRERQSEGGLCAEFPVSLSILLVSDKLQQSPSSIRRRNDLDDSTPNESLLEFVLIPQKRFDTAATTAR